MNIELILRLAKDAGLDEKGLGQLKRDLELYENGVAEGEKRRLSPPVMLPRVPTPMPSPGDALRWPEFPNPKPSLSPLRITCGTS